MAGAPPLPRSRRVKPGKLSPSSRSSYGEQPSPGTGILHLSQVRWLAGARACLGENRSGGEHGWLCSRPDRSAWGVASQAHEVSTMNARLGLRPSPRNPRRSIGAASLPPGRLGSGGRAVPCCGRIVTAPVSRLAGWPDGDSRGRERPGPLVLESGGRRDMSNRGNVRARAAGAAADRAGRHDPRRVVPSPGSGGMRGGGH